MLPLQEPSTQSAPVVQAWPVLHLVAQLPPQSTSVSSPFTTPSLQLGSAHTFPEQTPLRQSACAEHCLPRSQPAQLPPQSTSVSSPFWTLSVHEGPVP
jgi:hypothetical protein